MYNDLLRNFDNGKGILFFIIYIVYMLSELSVVPIYICYFNVQD